MVRLLLAALLCLGVAIVTVVNGYRTTAQGSAPDILISRQLSEAFHVGRGDTLRLSTDPDGSNAREFRVVSVYEPAADPMRLNAVKHEARMHLTDLLSITADPSDPLATEHVDAINVALANPDDATAFARDVMARFPGITAQAAQTASNQADLFIVLQRFHLAIAIITIVASTVFLLALTVMLVDERRETVGILRLIGLSTRRILRQVFVEGLLIAVVGALFGLVFAVASEGLINRYFQWRYDTALVFVRITPEVAWRCVIIAVPLGAIASVVASWTLLRRSVLVLARR
jgi:putative ABC transport system permease protein